MSEVLQLTIVIDQEREDLFAVRCVELGTVSGGYSIPEALHNIKEAVMLEIEILTDRGQRDRVFCERGIRVMPSNGWTQARLQLPVEIPIA